MTMMKIKRTYWMIGAALFTAVSISGCQNQTGTAAGGTSAQETEKEAEQNGTGGVVGSNFISQSSKITEIPIESLGNIALADYGQVNVTLPSTMADTQATDADIDTYIRSQLQTELKDVTDRGAQKGDIVTVDYEGLLNGKSFSGNKGTDYPITLGSGQMLPDFESAIYGAKAGDKVKAEVNFPQDYSSQEVAGKKAQFEITVKKLQEPSVLDESFIKSHTRTAAVTEAEYREEVKTRIQSIYENQLQLNAVTVALNQIASNSTLEPSSAFQNYLYEYYKQDLDTFLEKNNLSMDDYKAQTGLDDKGIENAIQTNVQNNIAMLMVMRQIARDQDLDDPETMKETLVSYLSELYDTRISEADLEETYGTETSEMELQASVYEYMKDHVIISFEEAESAAQNGN